MFTLMPHAVIGREAFQERLDRMRECSDQEESWAYTVGRDIVPFSFNPLLPPPGTDPYTWLKKLIEIIAHAYYLGEGVMFLLQGALHSIYTECGMYKPLGPDRIPTLKDILNWLLKHPVKGRQALWMDSTLRGIQSLCFGRMGEVLNATEEHTDLASFLERQVILELDALTSADKTFLVEGLLLWIHHYRLGQGRREEFKHALIIEEAHHILLKRSAGRGGEAVTDTILREIRELGEAVVLVDQHPSLISVPALGNTYITIAMNLKHRLDVSAVGATMLLEEEGKHLLGQLPVGWAIVKLQGRWTEPFVIHIPHLKLPKGAITDQILSRTARERGIKAAVTGLHPLESADTPFSGDRLGQLSKREESLLRDVAEHSLSGVVERYRLGLNRRRGNAAKEACLERRLLRQVPIPTRTGRVALLELTHLGREVLKEKGYPTKQRPPAAHRGSLEHEYWRAQVAHLYRERGYRVTLEDPIDRYVDLVAEKGDQRIGIEIETGKSNWRHSIARDLAIGFTEVVVVCTNEAAFLEIGRAAKDRWHSEAAKLRVVRAQEFCA